VVCETGALVSQFEFDFDFEHWRILAEKDPATFFAERELVLARFIAAAPARLSSELHDLQALIDHYRAEAGTPTNASRQLMVMMGDYLAALAGQMAQLREQSTMLSAMLSPDAND